MKGCHGVLLLRSPQASGCHRALQQALPRECTAWPSVWTPGCACFQTCSGYLLQRGMDSRKILAHLRALTCRVSRAPQTLCATPGHGGRLPLFQFREVETPGQGGRSRTPHPLALLCRCRGARPPPWSLLNPWHVVGVTE